ncbi:VTT domain-containing protein [Methanolobus sp.]|uniref:VTT domain-containing protein n=1 Tax=Methanolobus sp. TaxID=1874737 RepID=UPI0025DBA161|nr:VTT domain-containing protein [Methanolobus sp.]
MPSEDNITGTVSSGKPTTFCTLTDDAVSTRRRDILILGLLIIFILAWSVFLVHYPPEEIVGHLGVNNTYLLVFLLAAIGGVSAFTSTSFYTALVTISLGGVEPVCIAVFASVGLTLGDIVFYVIGKKGKQCVPSKYGKHLGRSLQLVKDAGDKKVALLIFAYSLTPLPSDILAIGLALAGFPLKKMVPPLLIGNFVLILVLAELAVYGYQLF